jgi:hypothetical protein
MRGKRRPRTVSLMRHFVIEVRDGRPLVRRSHGCVDVVFDARLPRQRCMTLALRLFPFDALLPSALHTEDAHAPANTLRSVASSSRSPLTMSPPWRASAAAHSLSGLRVRPRRWNPAPRNACATAPP